MTARILLIGSPRWEASLRRNWAITRFSSAKRAMTFADAQPFSAIIVDAVSMHTSGARICRTMREHYPGCPVILIQPLRYAKGEISTDVTLHPPVSARQLIGIVSRIIRQDPREIVVCGPFALNCTTRTLRTNRQEVQLSPKLAALIALFLSHPNQDFVPRNHFGASVEDRLLGGYAHALRSHSACARTARRGSAAAALSQDCPRRRLPARDPARKNKRPTASVGLGNLAASPESLLDAAQLHQLLHQAALAAGSIALVHDAAARKLVQVTYRLEGRIARLVDIPALYRCPRLLDQRTRAIAISAIVYAPFFILADSLNCRLMICHLLRAEEAPLPHSPFTANVEVALTRLRIHTNRDAIMRLTRCL